jgi:hypothetical protein
VVLKVWSLCRSIQTDPNQGLKTGDVILPVGATKVATAAALRHDGCS